MVEVTAHGGARPEHAEWQGKIYSRSGKSKKYPSLIEKTGYGTGPGLGGWNCRHNMFPFYEGMSRAYTDKELEELKPTKENDIILTDDEKFALNNYISSYSYKINYKLRRNIRLNESDKIMLTNLDNALDKIKDYKGNVVRTLYITDKSILNEFLDKNKLNKISSWNEYLSFSNKDNYNDKANIKIYVFSSKGKDIREYNKSESEILYKRNSKFITKSLVNKDNVYYIMWEEVDE